VRADCWSQADPGGHFEGRTVVKYSLKGETVMKYGRASSVVSGVVFLLALGARPVAAAEKVLFDFENDADLAAWSQFLPDNPKIPGAKAPPVKIELSGENATSGKRCLKLTFSKRDPSSLPAWSFADFSVVAAPSPLDDWTPYKSFRVDVTAGRTCLAAFRVVSRDDKEHRGWVKLALLHQGRNAVVDVAPPLKGPTQFEIILYAPHEGEALYVDNIRVSTEATQTATPPHGEHVYLGDRRQFYPKLGKKIPVLGLGIEVDGVEEFGERMMKQWVRPQDKTVEQVEAEFKALYEGQKKEHPRAVMAIFRDGQKGFDPAAPEKVYAGWASTGVDAHGPNANLLETLTCLAGDERMSVSLRGRPVMLRVDLASVPQGSRILAARLLLVRQWPSEKEWPMRPSLFVAEFCNRPWKEKEVNTFQYAKDRFWKETHGSSWDGADPDFLPIIAAYGPGQGTTNVWDFTEAVKWWTDGKHPNHGFTLNNAGRGLHNTMGFDAYSRWAKEISRRPAMVVIYEPK
jgi:hypothetical protein